ncbi:MAG: hypothetical protein KDA61_06795 [Planctomycetales bacterium]|nr:hypothetical protein [Planctomycetales bacterium]
MADGELWALRQLGFLTRRILLLLGGGLFIVLVLMPAMFHRNDDHGVGEYYGVIVGRIYGDRGAACLTVNAKSRASWRWSPPETYVYDTLDVTLVDSDGTEFRGRLRVPEMVLEGDEKAESMPKEVFVRRLVGESQFSESTDRTAGELFEMLRTAGTGEFPPPKHHYYDIGDETSDLNGYVAHWSHGSRVPLLIVGWGVVWGVALLARVRRLLSTARTASDSASLP